MPPRYVYWTIIAGGLPTAFRAADREELRPTFNRLKSKHPDAEMKYFARGKLWASAEDADRDAAARRSEGRRPVEGRGRTWRPGGEHVDPRQQYKDAKKIKNVARRKQRFERRQGVGVAGPSDDTSPRPRGPERSKSANPLRDRSRVEGSPRERPSWDRKAEVPSQNRSRRPYRPSGGLPRDKDKRRS
jgi:hypothetical protein